MVTQATKKRRQKIKKASKLGQHIQFVVAEVNLDQRLEFKNLKFKITYYKISIISLFNEKLYKSQTILNSTKTRELKRQK